MMDSLAKVCHKSRRRKSSFRFTGKLGQAFVIGGYADELGKASTTGFFSFGADHPPDRDSLIRGRLRLEKFPRGGVGFELCFIGFIERVRFLFKRVADGLLRVVFVVDLPTGGLDQSQF
jgi:hypothetical protein